MCIDRHQTGFVGEGSDHLQLIKFWPSRASGRGSAAGALLQPACSVCVAPERFFILFFCGMSALLGIDGGPT